MKRRVLRWVLVLAVGCGVALSASGCALWNRVQTTQISVQVAGDKLLHMAAVPRTLPDGGRPTEQLAALLKEMGEKAGGYTLIENVTGGWVPPGKTEIQVERNDLLLVAGPPSIALILRKVLRDDFKQEHPFVISVPLQSIVVIPQPTQPGEGAPAGETSAAAPVEAASAG